MAAEVDSDAAGVYDAGHCTGIPDDVDRVWQGGWAMLSSGCGEEEGRAFMYGCGYELIRS
jgi:hypothetical protein